MRMGVTSAKKRRRLVAQTLPGIGALIVLSCELALQLFLLGAAADPIYISPVRNFSEHVLGFEEQPDKVISILKFVNVSPNIGLPMLTMLGRGSTTGTSGEKVHAFVG